MPVIPFSTSEMSGFLIWLFERTIKPDERITAILHLAGFGICHVVFIRMATNSLTLSQMRSEVYVFAQLQSGHALWLPDQ